MQHGDLALSTQKRVLLVLEDTLAQPTYRQEGRWRKHDALNPAEEWVWSIVCIKTIQRYAYNMVPVVVITFLGEAVMERAAEWMMKYDVHVSAFEHDNFDMFCEALRWRLNDIHMIVDANYDRVQRYGQHGLLTQWGAEW